MTAAVVANVGDRGDLGNKQDGNPSSGPFIDTTTKVVTIRGDVGQDV